jgi:hypothetical protein
MPWTASGEHWSEEITVTHDDGTEPQRLFYLKLAYVTQLHEDGPWHACCLGQRFGGFDTKERAMRRCGEWLAENWHKVEWMKSQ